MYMCTCTMILTVQYYSCLSALPWGFGSRKALVRPGSIYANMRGRPWGDQALSTPTCGEGPGATMLYLCQHAGKALGRPGSIYANMRGRPWGDQALSTPTCGEGPGATRLYLRQHAGKTLDRGPREHNCIYTVMQGNTSQTTHLGQHGRGDHGPRGHCCIYAVMRGKTSQTAPSMPAWGGAPWTSRTQLYLRCYAGKHLADNPSRTAWEGGTMDLADTALSTLLCGETPRRQLHLRQHGWGVPWNLYAQLYLRCYAG